jgi:acyl-[acyl-carrier-protein]-phospholipid O-acyltransferase/long-chain-fatty-acid--[acyl-carrier-protein] ligase
MTPAPPNEPHHAAIPRSHDRLAKFIRTFFGVPVRLIYRLDIHGLAHLPAAGGVLLLPNHITWIDAIILQLACPRPIRFMVFEGIYRWPILNPIFRLFGVIPVSPVHAKEGVRLAAARLQAGEVVCIFPEGELTRTGTLLRLKKGYELIARLGDKPVVPVWLDQLWGSIFSFEGGRFFRKWPRRLPYPVTIAFGEPLTPALADVATVREKLLVLGAACYDQRPALKRHLAEACLRGLKRGLGRVAVVDGLDHSTLSRGMLLAAGIVLARHLRVHVAARRVGIVLPASKGAVLANLGVLLAGKVPVGLNFTAGRDALEHAIRQAEIDTVITAAAFERKLENFPWPANVLRLEQLLPPLKKRIGLWRVLVTILPWRALARLLRIPRQGGHEEAVLLFTSGSAGQPKGVILSHHNLLANISQFRVMINFTARDTILASLPFFHSFGCTVTLWFPLLEGLRVVTYPNPLEAGKNAELVARYGCSLLLATPTFLRGYLRKAERAQLASVKLVVTGAEKLPRALAEAFEEKFGHQVMEGYGLTETSPVVSVNLPDVSFNDAGHTVQHAYRPGSVGKLAPGMAAQTRNPDTDAPLPLTETGMLWLRGPNIFEGYLGLPQQTAEVIRDGWFRSGDLGRVDEDGFLFIEGRLSRFSKIGGEMVPHETVEAKILEALAMPADGERHLVVMGVPDEAKGEALVVLTTIDIEQADLRAKLSALGVANLWIPRRVRRVEALPVLGTGKLDLKGCRDLALAE